MNRIEISKDSWHYKMMYEKYASWYINDMTLCSYVSRLVGLLLASIMRGMFKLFIVILLVFFIAIILMLFVVFPTYAAYTGYIMPALSIDTTIFHSLMDYFPINKDRAIQFGEVMLISDVILVFTALLTYIYSKIVKHCFLNPKHSNKPKKKPSLIYSYIKAKKDKVCPLIKFVD